MARTIKVGSWAHVQIPGRRKFTTRILSTNRDGSFNVSDPRGNLRSVPLDYLTPANQPRKEKP
jgi:hypothetical protein